MNDNNYVSIFVAPYSRQFMTIFKHIITGILCTFALMAVAQVPQNIQLNPESDASSRACPDRNAGTVSLGTFTGQSNDVTLNRTYLCLNDRLFFDHNGDQEVIDSDPNPGTTPGVGYIWYTCAPTVQRTTLMDIQTDPCLLTNPTPALGAWVYVDDINGDALFQNGNQIGGQSIPDFFNSGEPVEIWFAPFTVDAVTMAGQPVLEGSPTGPCVHANTDAAFSIVYLTPMSVRNRTIISDGAGGCLGSFRLFGGLPQFENSSYTITIESETTPGVFGTLTGSNYGHGDEVNFTFPEDGRYMVTVEDGKSCMTSFTINTDCVNPNSPVIFNVSSVTGNVGDLVDVNVTFENFNALGAIFSEMQWNPNVLEFVSQTGFQIGADGISNFNEAQSNQGRLIYQWIANNLVSGQTEPDGSLFFSVQYRIVGECNDMTPIDLVDVIVVDFNNEDNLFEVNAGQGLVMGAGNSAIASACPDDGSGNGSITVEMCGGMPNYVVTYSGRLVGGGSITEQDGSITFDGLFSGTYDFIVRDDNGTGTPITFSIDIPSGAQTEIDFDIIPPDCANTDDGTVMIDITPPGTYGIAWSTNEFNTDVIRNVANGQYRVTVTDQNGCETEASFTVNSQPLLLTATVDSASCNTSEDGRISLSVVGGLPFSDGTYEFSGPGLPPTRATSIDYTDLPVGQYMVTVRDSNGCLEMATYEIASDKSIVLDLAPVIDHVTCFGADNGDLMIEVSTINGNNDGGYIFEWERGGANVSGSFRGGTNADDFSESFPANTLPAGIYNVTITDTDEGTGCILDTFFEITQPDEIQMDVLRLIPASCNGSDGELIVEGLGGLDDPDANLFFDWSDIDKGVTTFSNLAADTYDVTIFQRIGMTIFLDCFLDTFVIVPGDEGATIIGYDSMSVSCGGLMDGELEVFFTPSNPAALITWTDQNNVTYDGARITGLGSGTYIVTVESAPGCIATDTVSLGASTDIMIDSVLYTTPTCPNSFNGAVRIFASGPGGTLDYAWDHPNGSNNPVLPSVPPGTYSVTISANSTGCPPLIIDTLNVPSPDIFTTSFSNITGARCPGICDGRATISASGGTGPIGLLWSSGEVNATATSLCAGENFVVVSDNICIDTFFVDINAADSITVVSNQANPSCFGDMDGFIRISPSGNNPPFDILWDDGPIIPNRLNLGAGDYTVTVTDAMGCERVDEFTLTEPEQLMASIEPGDLGQITCAGRNDGRVFITTTGGTGDYAYTWSPNVSQTNTAQGLMPDDYTVMVSDENGCTAADIMFSISEPPLIQFVLGSQSQIQCFGETAEFTVDTAFGGAGGPYTFIINGGAVNDLGETVSLFGGDYVVSVVDSSGCFIDENITIVQPQEFSVDIGEDLTISLGDSARLGLNVVTGSFPIDSIIWTSTADGLSCSFCPAPWITPFVDGMVNVLVIDSTGCSATDDLNVFVDARRKVYIPNAFSPNNDGINDVFSVFTGLGVQQINNFQVFNRWGGRVYDAMNLPASDRGAGSWDGTNNGRVLNPGVYPYVIQVEFFDGRVITYSGEVTLIR